MQKIKPKKQVKHIPHQLWIKNFNGPHGTAIAIILNKKNEVCLIRRKVGKFKGFWCLPGGYIERYELAEDTARRETLEETGLTVYKMDYFNHYEELFPKYQHHSIGFAFVGKTKEKPMQKNNEASQIKFFQISKARKMKLAFRHNHVLDDFAELENKIKRKSRKK